MLKKVGVERVKNFWCLNMLHTQDKNQSDGQCSLELCEHDECIKFLMVLEIKLIKNGTGYGYTNLHK